MSQTTDKTIIDSFKQEARDKGVAHVTIGNVADRCGCARQTIYYHFHGTMDLIRWITANECSDCVYDSIMKNRWKNEMYRLLNALKSNDWLVQDIRKSKFWSEFNEVLMEIIQTRVIHSYFITCSDYGSTKSRGTLTRMLTYTFTGEVIEWIKSGFDENPEEIMRDFDRLCGSSMHRVIEDFLTFRPQEQTA